MFKYLFPFPLQAVFVRACVRACECRRLHSLCRCGRTLQVVIIAIHNLSPSLSPSFDIVGALHGEHSHWSSHSSIERTFFSSFAHMRNEMYIDA